MKSSWKLGQLAGIDVYVHWSFLLVPAWLGILTLFGGGTVASLLGALALIGTVFGCVVLHELGHALAARHYGIQTRDITLLPIGGVARLERMPTKPLQEIAVALAGPAVNVVIAAALFAGLALSGQVSVSSLTTGSAGMLITQLMWINLVLALFNLLPAFPLDGGRVFRAALSLALPYERATQIAAVVGQALGIALVALGLLSNWMLMLVGVFVFLAAGAEAEMVRSRSVMGTAEISEDSPLVLLPARAPVRLTAQWLFQSQQQRFPVLDRTRVVGVLSREELYRALFSGRGERPVGDLIVGRTVWRSP